VRFVRAVRQLTEVNAMFDVMSKKSKFCKRISGLTWLRRRMGIHQPVGVPLGGADIRAG
jgi:hypothetical protein